ncbi:hypothetical protein [Nannocystis bainbridge]|uniref:Tetratricopeptide repeat protein n=1 Tax=Nannocystis bainbridge TaxID=2995303 RepID=A0ABT5E7T3_9BACT|nr:hypothetical protein [Nannocystis bainbridge]MDC0721926.1 hypothetical protein [Nannocystis bainbridge]
MSEAPALVSATLAQLYMQQDHLEQARRVIQRVLAADPLHGHALVLADRLANRSRARLYAAFQPGSGVVVRWHDAPPEPALHLILAVFRAVPAFPGRTSTQVTSIRCRAEAGEHTFPIAGGPRPSPASASLCLARLAPDGLQLLAVHEAISWPTPTGP